MGFNLGFKGLKLCSSFLRLLPLIPVTSNFPFIFPSVTCFRRQPLRKIWSVQVAFLLFTVCRTIFSCLTLCNTSSFLTRSVQQIVSILLQHHISKLSTYSISFSEVSKFQHRTKLCSKSGNLLVSYSNLSPFCRRKGLLRVQCQILLAQFNKGKNTRK